MDIAYDAITAGESRVPEVTLSMKQGFLSFPKQLPPMRVLGRTLKSTIPIDTLISNLFENAYVHQWVRQSHLRWFVSDFVLKKVFWLVTGTSAGWGQWVGQVSADRCGRAYNILNKSSRALPYLNKGHAVPRPFLDRLARLVVPEPERGITSKPRLLRLSAHRAYFEDGSSIACDQVIFATGYIQRTNFLEKSAWRQHRVREILNPASPRVSFMGLVRPGVGAIPPMVEQQAMWWVMVLDGRLDPGSVEPETYKLLFKPDQRIDYAVDYSGYVYQLASDMGAAPGFLDLVGRPRVLLSYFLGAAFVPFFRLSGPFRHPAMDDTATGELWETVTRRRLGGNLLMAIIPILFYGVVNTLCFLVHSIGRLLRLWR